MTETYFPFDSGAGGASYEDRWSKMASLWRDNGVIRGLTNELAVSANSSGMQVFVNTGVAWFRGFYYENDASLAVAIDAHDTQDRIDRIVLRLDTAGNTLKTHVLRGTPGTTPVEPALLSGPALFDLPLARVYVHNTAVTIAGVDVTDERIYADRNADLLDGIDSSAFVQGSISSATPGALTFGGAGSAGSGTALSRGPHSHPMPTHTKADHDALGIDADTLDGHDTSFFLPASGFTKAAIDALNVDADTLDGIDSTAFASASSLTTETTNRQTDDKKRPRILAVDGPVLGSTPTLGTDELLEICGNKVVTPAAFGKCHIVFPTAFPNGILGIELTSGDAGAFHGFLAVGAGGGDVQLDEFYFYAYDTDGSVRTGDVRIFYRVVGW